MKNLLLPLLCLSVLANKDTIPKMEGVDMREFVPLTEGGFIQPWLRSRYDLPYLEQLLDTREYQHVKQMYKHVYVLDPSDYDQCDAFWDYNYHGIEWECMCETGVYQSPIDIPPLSSNYTFRLMKDNLYFMFPAFLHDSLSDNKDVYEKGMSEEDRQELLVQDLDVQDQRVGISPRQSIVQAYSRPTYLQFINQDYSNSLQGFFHQLKDTDNTQQQPPRFRKQEDQQETQIEVDQGEDLEESVKRVNKDKMQGVYNRLSYQLLNKNQYLVYNYNSYSLVTDLGSLSLPPLGLVYKGSQVNFHSPSEHLLGGKRFDLEAHLIYSLVHPSDLLRQEEELLQREKHNDMRQQWKSPLDIMPNLVVVLLFSLSEEQNQFLASLGLEKDITVQKVEKLLDFSLLFSQTLDQEQPSSRDRSAFEKDDHSYPLSEFFLYQGSFSTPSCEETVTYVVDSDIHPVSQEQLTIIQDYTTNKGQTKGNYRVQQLVNGRYIWVHSHRPEIVSRLLDHMTTQKAQCAPQEYLLNYTSTSPKEQYIISNQPKESLEGKEGQLEDVPPQGQPYWAKSQIADIKKENWDQDQQVFIKVQA